MKIRTPIASNPTLNNMRALNFPGRPTATVAPKAGGGIVYAKSHNGNRGQYYAVSTANVASSVLYKSDDLQEWSDLFAPLLAKYTCVATDGDRVIMGRAVSSPEADRIHYTDTGVGKTDATGLSSTTHSILGVAVHSGHWYAVGEGDEIWVSNDGAAWTAATSAYSADLNKVIAFGTKAIVIDNGGGIQTTENSGAAWTNRTTQLSTAGSVRDACYAAHLDAWILVGDDGKVWFNPNDFALDFQFLGQMSHPNGAGSSILLKSIVSIDGMIVCIGCWTTSGEDTLGVYVCEDPRDQNGWRYANVGGLHSTGPEERVIAALGDPANRLVIGSSDPPTVLISGRL